MKTANAIQGAKIARIARILKKDETLVGIAWVLRNGERWRDEYEANKLKPYHVSYRISGQTERKEKRYSEPEFNAFLEHVQDRNIINPTWHYNSIAIVKDQI